MLIEIMSKFVQLNGFQSTRGLDLPPTWVQAEVTRGRFSVAQCFHLKEQPEVTIIAFRRGVDLGEPAASQVRQILDRPAHVLDDLERQRIAEVLAEQGMRKRFTIEEVRTQDYNGRKVLITEGTYARNGERAFTIFIDALGDGYCIEEFQYAAPADEFTAHYDAVSAIFKAIRWSDIP